MIKQFILNAVNSWVTSAGGAILGVPEIYKGIQGLLDTDPATTIEWALVLKGAGILFAGMMMRDWTKARIPSERHPSAGA